MSVPPYRWPDCWFDTGVGWMSHEINTANPVIVFDGVCLLCNRWVQFVLRHDKQQQFLFAAMQSAAGQQLLMKHGLNPHDPLSFLLVDESGGYVDTDAIIRILTRLGGMWKLATLIRIIPTVIRDAMYRVIARNRYRWFGKRASCMVPSPEVTNRFI